MTKDSVQRSNGKVETSHHPETDPRREDKNYYGIPPIKHAHWTWQIPVYFWIGGRGAGVFFSPPRARFLGNREAPPPRTSRYTVLGTMILSPILLIWDLGRPERFYNMLRILKLRSPMSTQSWSVFAFGNLGGLIAARQAAEDGLLGEDNPLVKLARLIPARFLSLVLHLTPSGEEKTLRPLHRAEKATLSSEAGLMAASLLRMSRGSKPLFSRDVAPLFVGGTLFGGILAPMALLFGKESRPKSILASVLALTGGLAFRFAII